MIVTSDMEKGIVNKIDCIILTFEDDTEIRIGKITNCDLDLYDGDTSYILFTTVFMNNKLLSKVHKKLIKHINIKIDEIDVNDRNSIRPLILDISCNMKIKRCRVSGDINSVGDMSVELEGMVY